MFLEFFISGTFLHDVVYHWFFAFLLKTHNVLIQNTYENMVLKKYISKCDKL